jgi:hypothetical protein
MVRVSFSSLLGGSLLVTLLAGSLCGAVACSKKSQGGASEGGASSATPSASSQASSEAAPHGSAWVRGSPFLAQRFAEEAKSRPTGTPTVEAVFDAFAKAGTPVHGIYQHLGSPIRANYCMGALADNGIAMSVCEAADEAAAVYSKDQSAKAFPTLKRDYYVNKKTFLAVQQPNPRTPASEAEAKALGATFSGL